MHRFLSFLLAGAGPLLAQTTWIVDADGGGDFTDLSAAVQAAADGDTVLVRYRSGLSVSWNCTLSKSLTIVGVGAERAETIGHLVIADLAPHQRVVLRSLQPSPVVPYPSRVTVQDCAGRVVLEDVALHGALGQMFGDPGLQVIGSQRVHVGRSVLGGEVGLVVSGSTVTCTGTRITGSSVGSGPGSAAPAVTATASRLWLAGCVLTGGSNLNLGGFSGPGRSGLVLHDSGAVLAATDVLGGYGFSGFAASVASDAPSSTTVDAATFLRDGTSGAGALAAAETGSLSGWLGPGWSTFTLAAAPGACGFLLLSLPGPEIATPFGPCWLASVPLPIAFGAVPVAQSLPAPWWLPPGFAVALQGVVLHGGALALSTPLVTTAP